MNRTKTIEKQNTMTQEEFFSRYKYSIRKDKIGGGAFGTVYRAFDTIVNREVAIKVSEVKIIGDKEFSLKDEFDAIKNLPVHPNIANYEELYTFEFPQGIFDHALMQFYKDGNLSVAIKQGMSDKQKHQVALDLLKGIHHLHNHKVVHRDLKPGNILIVKRDDLIIPIITDFGLSKQTGQETQSRFSNSFGGGTLKYSSPEQLKGENLRLNTDLWAYGVIVYEIFTGENLFKADGHSSASAEAEEEIFKQIKNKDISKELQKLPEKWQKTVAVCLVRNSAKRVKSSSYLLEIIQRGNTYLSTEGAKSNTYIEEETKNEEPNIIHKSNNETFIEEEKTNDDKVGPKKEAEQVQKSNYESSSQAWLEIKDTNEIDAFVNYRKKYPYSNNDRKAKNIILFNLFKKTFPKVNLKRMLLVTTIASYLTSISLFFYMLKFYFYLEFLTEYLLYYDITFSYYLYFSWFDVFATGNFDYDFIMGILLFSTVLFYFIYITINIYKSLRHKFIHLIVIWGIYNIYLLSSAICTTNVLMSDFNLTNIVGVSLTIIFLSIIFYTIKSKIFSIPKLIKQLKVDIPNSSNKLKKYKLLKYFIVIGIVTSAIFFSKYKIKQDSMELINEYLTETAGGSLNENNITKYLASPFWENGLIRTNADELMKFQHSFENLIQKGVKKDELHGSLGLPFSDFKSSDNYWKNLMTENSKGNTEHIRLVGVNIDTTRIIGAKNLVFFIVDENDAKILGFFDNRE